MANLDILKGRYMSHILPRIDNKSTAVKINLKDNQTLI